MVSENATGNPKKFWEYGKSKTKIKERIPDLDVPGTEDINNNTRRTENDLDKANTLLHFFNSVFTKEAKEDIPTLQPRTNKLLDDLDITRDMVLKKLKKLKINKSPGPHGIHPRVYSELSEVLAYPLAVLYQISMTRSEVPQD